MEEDDLRNHSSGRRVGRRSWDSILISGGLVGVVGEGGGESDSTDAVGVDAWEVREEDGGKERGGRRSILLPVADLVPSYADRALEIESM